MSITYPHISIDPAVDGGRPRVGDTALRVTELATAIDNGRTPFELQEHFASRPLTLGEIYSALSYYHDHKQELALAAAEDKRVADTAESARLEKIKRYYLGLDPTHPER